MKFFVSNDMEKLAEALCHELFFAAVPPLTVRWVVVPSEECKWYLQRQWLGKVEAVAAVRMVSYREMRQRTFPNLPTRIALELKLQAALGDEQKEYLQGGGEKRRLDVCEVLAHLFLAYLERPQEEIIAWLSVDDWQQRLWKKVFENRFPTDEIRSLPGKLYFFHPTAITPREWEVFSRKEASWFLFSPTEMFLGDFKTTWQQEKMIAQAREDLAGLFESDSPLLSNWSVPHRKLLRLFENESSVELFMERKIDSALHAVQEEWRLLERQEHARDASLELHAAESRLHEVEIVWEKIQEAEGDVVIALPHPSAYAAAIEWVFQSRGGAYTLHGIDAQEVSPLLQGLAILLSLPRYQFAQEKLEKLLFCPPFLRRFKLSMQEGERLRQWMGQFDFRYGLHEGVHSLQAALSRAVQQAVETLDFTETSLLDTWIEIARLFTKKLAALSSPRTLSQWAVFIEEIVEAFFAEVELPCTVHALHAETTDTLYPYASIERVLFAPAETKRGAHLHGPCFVPLKRGAFFPAHTLIVMGLSEGNFPHVDAPSPLAEHATASCLEEDRATFLEAISCAQERLILTYVRVHPEDGKEVRPSSVVEELARDRKGITTVRHTRDAVPDRKFSAKHGTLAAPATLDVRQLKKIARHPIQTFFEASLKLEFSKPPSSEFLLSPLDLHRARALSLERDLDAIIALFLAEGKIPAGGFQGAALLMLEQEISTYKEALAALHVDATTLFSLELTPHANKLEQVTARTWIAPPLHSVHGRLDNLTPHGMLYHGDNSLATQLKVWPLWCIFSYYFGDLPLLLSKEGKKVATPIKDPHAALMRYLEYCTKALATPSPLMPIWGRKLLKDGIIPEEDDDPAVQWGRERALLPHPNAWVEEWRPQLMEVFCDLL